VKYIRTALVGAILIALFIPMMSAPASAHHRPWHCGGNDDVNVIVGTLGNNTLVGTPCDDLIMGLAGRDFIVGLGGEDRLNGNRGRDRLRGVDGEHDVLNGGRGFDRCRGDSIDTFVSCEVIVEVAVT
jgi:hypothetical protein